jgi:hypothetical protein
MCEPTTILAISAFTMSALQQQQSYEASKAKAAAQDAKNKQARLSANRAYLADLGELDRIKEKANKENAQVKEGKELELIKKQDKNLLKGLESGNANVEAALRDIGFDYESTFNQIDRKVYDTNINNVFGYDDAYAVMRRSYSKLPDVFQPSKAGLLIGLGASAVGTAADYNAGKYGKGSGSDLKTTSATSDWDIVDEYGG